MKLTAHPWCYMYLPDDFMEFIAKKRVHLGNQTHEVPRKPFLSIFFNVHCFKLQSPHSTAQQIVFISAQKSNCCEIF